MATPEYIASNVNERNHPKKSVPAVLKEIVHMLMNNVWDQINFIHF